MQTWPCATLARTHCAGRWLRHLQPSRCCSATGCVNMAGHPCCSCALCALRQPGLAAFFHVVVTLNLAVRACVTGPLWQDALRADLALCNAGKDALRGEVAAAAAAITVLQRDRVRACKLGGWVFFLRHVGHLFFCSGCCCGDLHGMIFAVTLAVAVFSAGHDAGGPGRFTRQRCRAYSSKGEPACWLLLIFWAPHSFLRGMACQVCFYTSQDAQVVATLLAVICFTGRPDRLDWRAT